VGTGVGADRNSLGGLGSEPLDEDEVRVACEGLMRASMQLGGIADGLSVAAPGLAVPVASNRVRRPMTTLARLGQPSPAALPGRRRWWLPACRWG